MSTLESVAALAPGSETVFSCSLPPHLLNIAERSARALHMAESGEPWKTYFDPQDLVTALRRRASAIVDFDAHEPTRAISGTALTVYDSPAPAA